MDRLGYWWRQASAAVSDEDLNRRPAPGVWSAMEYGLHSAWVLPLLRDSIERMVAHDRSRTPDPYPDLDIEDASRPLTLDPSSLFTDLEREGRVLARLVRAGTDGWHHVGLMDDGTWWQAEATLIHIVHDTTHHFLDVGEGLVRIGAALTPASGTVVSVNRPTGGPSPADASVAMPPNDLACGTTRPDRRAPYRAVSLWSAEIIDQLAAEGHAVGIGTAGENLTVSGLDWSSLRPGTRILAGTTLLELSYPMDPQAWEGSWFTDGDPSRLDHAQHPARARWSAWVRRPGQVRIGDRAILSPGSAQIELA
jgi:hypothetical protein